MTSTLRGALLAGTMACSAVGAWATADGPDFYRVTGVAADDMLNLRRGPGTGEDVIVGLPNGREVDLLRRDPNGWCLVALREAPDLQGFVACRYIGE